MVALDLDTGRVLWDTKLPQMAVGDATVVNDLVFTTTFDGHLIAFDRKTARSSGTRSCPAFTNAPIAIVGDTIITAASFPGGKPARRREVIAFRIGAHGSFTPAPAATGARRAAPRRRVALHPELRVLPHAGRGATPRARSDRTSTS